MRKCLAGICCLICLTVTSTAQTPAKDEQTTTIIFNQSGYGKSESTKNKKKIGDKDIIKIAPLGFLRGSFPLLYERRINDFLSVEGGAGLTHRNYVRGAYMTGEVASSNDYEGLIDDLSEPLYSFDYRKPAIGYMFSIQPRFYLGSDAMEGGYLAFGIEMFRYNFTTPKPFFDAGTGSTGFDPSVNINEHENIRDLMVYWGYQALYDRLTLETAAGIGIRKINGEKYVVTPSEPGGFMNYAANGLAFNLAIRLGFQL